MARSLKNVIIIFLFTSSLMAGESAKLIKQLPSLSKAESWTVNAEKDETLNVSELKDSLMLEFNANKGNVAELLLNKPVKMPEWTRNFHFLCTNNGVNSSLRLDVMVKDSTGRNLIFYTKSTRSWREGLFIPEHNDRRSCERLFSTPGLKDEKSLQAGNYVPVDGKRYNKPSPPYSLVGLRLRGNHQRGEKSLKLYLKDFVFSGLTPKNAGSYYLFKDQEFYGEISSLPYITAGELFRNKWGSQFQLCWELRDKYSGQPFMTGSKKFILDYKKDTFPLMLAEHIEIPIKEKGTYWLKVKTRWSKKVQKVPEIIEEKEFRLFIDKGDPKTAQTSVKPDFFEENNYIKIAPERKSYVFDFDEKIEIPVLFKKPDVEINNGLIEVKNAKGEVCKEMKVSSFDWNGDGVASVTLDLGGADLGSYQVIASIYTDKNKLFDRSTQLIGRKEKKLSDSELKPIPESVLSWQEQLGSRDPILFLTPLLSDSDGSRKNADLAWNKYFKPFLDEAGASSKHIEHQISWAKVEKLPGVFDWSSVDRFINYAGSKGLLVNLYSSVLAGSTPEWIPSIYERNQEGDILGHKAYLFHGGRINFLLEPKVRDRMIEFFERLVLRYRTHPAVMGYYLCVEHPRDAPYTGWYEGFSEENRKFFAAFCKNKWQDINTVNKRWGTDFKSFDDINHPNKNSSARFRTDWLGFRIDAIEKLYKDFVKSIRKYDKKRLIVVYTDGTDDFQWFRDHGCMTADGGSHNAMGVLRSKMFGSNGYHRRTEDHHPGNWTRHYPGEVEGSFFSISPGGAQMSHARAFIRTAKKSFKDQLAEQGQGIGRMQQRWPIWKELHDTTGMPVESFVLGDMNSLLALKNTTCVWTTYGGPYVTLITQAAHVNCSLGEDGLWKNGKLLMAPSSALTFLEDKTMDQIVEFVKNGGTFFMLAPVGRKSIDQPKQDWVLLKKLGFPAPQDNEYKKGYSEVVPGKNEFFHNDKKTFLVKNYWNVKASEEQGEKVASFLNKPDSCALSWKTLGKGKVAVLWANEIIPPRFSKNAKFAFLRNIAEWAGVRLYSDSTNPMLWGYLLEAKKRNCYYGMVHVAVWRNNPVGPSKGRVKWFLPEGKYEVTEMLSGKKLGELSAEKLSKEGLETTLGPHETAIYKMKKR